MYFFKKALNNVSELKKNYTYKIKKKTHRCRIDCQIDWIALYVSRSNEDEINWK